MADREAAEALTLAHLHLVPAIVRETMPRLPNHVRADDLTSAGNLGLVLAARSYDPARGVPFAKYARGRIRGAITDELRLTDWLPRPVRRQVRELQRARDRLTAELGRAPTPLELAAALGIDRSTLRQLERDAAFAAVDSLDVLNLDKVAGQQHDRTTSQAAAVEAAVETLPAHLQAVVHAAFHSPGTSHREAGAAAGIRPADFYHLRTEAIRALRARLGVPTPAGETRIPLPRRLAAFAA